MQTKIVSQTDDYFIKEMDFNGIPILFRVWKNYPEVEIRANNNLAKANGFKSIPEMMKEALGLEDYQRLKVFPEWIKVTEDGEFLLRVNRMKVEDMN